MTLVLNEIHVVKGLSNSVVIAAADRRITKQDGSYDSTRRKLFDVPSLNATVSYFGLATVYPKGRLEYLSSWLPNFIRNNADAASMEDFAGRLRDALHKVVPRPTLRGAPSGFHISGFASDGSPDFWFLTNVGGISGFSYTKLRDRYGKPRSDFLGRDASAKLGWDGTNPTSIKSGACLYRNGDFRAHALGAEHIDRMLAGFFTFPDFARPGTAIEYGRLVKFRLEVLAYVYQKWARKKIIARPIDVIVRSEGVR